MTFTKTSQKFGQWADTKANTVYGLGFSSEDDLLKVINLSSGCSNFCLRVFFVRVLLRYVVPVITEMLQMTPSVEDLAFKTAEFNFVIKDTKNQ